MIRSSLVVAGSGLKWSGEDGIEWYYECNGVAPHMRKPGPEKLFGAFVCTRVGFVSARANPGN